MAAAGPTTHVIGKLSATQVAAYARNAGFPDSELPMAVEVARLESGFDPTKVGVLDPRDLGLYQINSHYHPEVLKINWKDAQANTNLAHTIWLQRGWGEWHTSLAARAALASGATDSKAAAASAKATQQQADIVPNAINTALAPIEAFNRIGQWISNPRNILRIAEVGLGGGLLLVAIAMISRPVAEPVAKVATQVAEVATPYGRVAKAWSGGRWK